MFVNRSTFQIWHDFFYCIIISLILIVNVNNTEIFCFSIKGDVSQFLKELKYKNITFKCSRTVNDVNAFNSLDIFINSGNYNNFNFDIIKYFEIKNNLILPFKKNSCYSHPNLFFGIYNNLYFNLQFSHNIVDENFKFFLKKDVFGFLRSQYLCNQLYIYDSNLNKQFLNFDSLNLNNKIAYKNNIENSKEIQNYINLNSSRFDLIIKKTLKI